VGAILKLRDTRAQTSSSWFSRLAFISAFAATFALETMFPRLQFFTYIPPVFVCLLPVAWAYAFWKLTPDRAHRACRLAVVSPIMLP